MKMDETLRTWNTGKFDHDRIELSKYKLYLVGIQEVRLDRDATGPAGEYTFF